MFSAPVREHFDDVRAAQQAVAMRQSWCSSDSEQSNSMYGESYEKYPPPKQEPPTPHDDLLAAKKKKKSKMHQCEICHHEFPRLVVHNCREVIGSLKYPGPVVYERI